MNAINEERVFWREKFFGEKFDFQSRIVFCRFDACLFVDCIFLFDGQTEQLAFTNCTFKDCNVESIEPDDVRALVLKDNFFDRPLKDRKADFDLRLAEALRGRAKL